MATYRVAESLLKLRDQINDAYPNRNKGSDGTIGDEAHQAEGTSSDHNPFVKDRDGVGVVRALDITHDPANGVDTYAMADRLRASGDRRISYGISRGRIYFGAGNPNAANRLPLYTWRAFDGDPHNDHMHVSVSKTQDVYDNDRPWVGVTPQEDDMDATQAQQLADVHFATTSIPDPINPGKRIPLQTAMSRLLSAAPATLSDAQIQAIADRLVASSANGLTAADHAGIVADVRSVFEDAAS